MLNLTSKDCRTIKCPKIVPLLFDCTQSLSSALVGARTACRLSTVEKQWHDNPDQNIALKSDSY
jgi:hypothetical protein